VTVVLFLFALTAKRKSRVDVEFGVLDPPSTNGAVAIDPGHESIQGFVDETQTSLQISVSLLPVNWSVDRERPRILKQQLTDIFSLASQLMPNTPAMDSLCVM
jgi:hypothetical protein